MRVLQVVPTVAIRASGLTYYVQSLSRELHRRGVDVSLQVLDPVVREPGTEFEIRGYPQFPWPAALRLSPAMKAGLAREARGADILHNNGLWTMPNAYPARAVRGTRCRLVTSPHGVFSEWAMAYSRWKKRLFWVVQRAAVERADLLHATADSEHQEIRRLGLRAPVAVVPNGMDVPPLAPAPAGGPRRLVFLSRLHPKKGVDALLRVWRRLQDDFPDWELQVCGPGDPPEYGATLARLAQDLGTRRAVFTGPLFGDAKLALLRGAQLFVLPTHSENFGLVVAEALASAVPVVVSKGAPWEGLLRERCGWWHEIGEQPLEAALREAMSASPAQLREMGLRGRAWVEREFAWPAVAARMQATYEWLLGGGARPDWVRVD